MAKAIISAAFAAVFLVAMACAIEPLPVVGTNHVAQCVAECDPRPLVYVDFTTDPPRCLCK